MLFRLTGAFILLAISFFTVPVQAQEFRIIQPIATPVLADTPLAEGARPVKKIIPLDRRVIEETMQEIARSWNTPDMSQNFAATLQDKDRLMDSMNAYAPVDAQLRLLSIGSYRVLAQEIKEDDQGAQLISRVSVIARTQVEYNDPENGFQRRPGEQEYIIKITQKVFQ